MLQAKSWRTYVRTYTAVVTTTPGLHTQHLRAPPVDTARFVSNKSLIWLIPREYSYFRDNTAYVKSQKNAWSQTVNAYFYI